MEKKLKPFAPPVIATLFFLLYMVVYRPAPGTKDFSTAILVFFGALGSVALILLTAPESKKLKYVYVAVSLLVPPLLLYLFKISAFDPILHPLLTVLTAMGFSWFLFYLSTARST